MHYTSLKEFAEQHNISYEAARKSYARYAKDLDGHVVTMDRTRLLDDYAVEYLEEKRRASPVVMVTETHAEELKELTAEVEKLKEQLLSAQEEYIQLQDKHVKAQYRIIELQETAREALTMRENLERAQKEIEEIRSAAAEQKAGDAAIISRLMQERNEAQKEADSFRPSLFGFYRRKK